MRGSALTTLVGGIIILVVALYLLVKLASSGYYGDVADTTSTATQTRIMPSGMLVLGDGTEPGQRTGKQVFDKVCLQCHAADSNIQFAPKITHNDQWASRIAKGFDTLVNHAIHGFTGPDGGVMPAKGGAVDFTDDEIARAVAYMINQSGGHVEEPSPQSNNTQDETELAAIEQTVPDRGQEVFEQSCKACHGVDSPIPGSPKLTNVEDWAPRIKQGEATLMKHAIEGFTGDKGFMPAKGGNANLSDDDVKAAVHYMIKHSGG